MSTLLRIEEALLTLLALFLFLSYGFDWWLFVALLLAPDLALFGYLLGPRAGAFAYNLAHHKGLAVALFVIGSYMAIPSLQIAGLIILAHSSLDRMIGYGLKYTDSFHHTHLGWIGRRGG
jgi:hypothetical protein